MGINYETWLGNPNTLSTTTKQRWAARAWDRIQRKPTSVVFTPVVGADLAAQTVRLDFDNDIAMTTSDAGAAALRGLVVLGLRDHATLPDTDIKVGDTFWLNLKQYRVQQVNDQQVGQIEARAEVVN